MSKAIRPLVEAKPADEPLRVWVPGCASGEEAYSLAILLMEEVAAARKNSAVQVFATDIDEEALKFARLGVYPESIVADVEADRLSKFFVRKESGYQISECAAQVGRLRRAKPDQPILLFPRWTSSVAAIC